MHIYALNMHLICINKYAYNIYKYASNMHQICKKLCRKYAENMPLHKLQHSKNMQIICKKICKKICSICNKNMQKNMQKKCRICISLCVGIFCIYMHSPLCWWYLEILDAAAASRIIAGIVTISIVTISLKSCLKITS